MESVRQLNVSGLTNLHKQFPEDCPYTLDKDDSCSTQDFCVKIARMCDFGGFILEGQHTAYYR